MNKFYIKISKYLSIAYVNLKNSTAYKSEFVFICLRNFIVILIYINFFTLTFQSSESSQFNGLKLNQILWLLILIRTFAVDWSTATLISNEIRSGDLAYTITRPYSYILSHYASFHGRRLPQFLFGDLPSNLIIAFFLIGSFPATILSLFVSLWLVLIGISIEFLAQVIIGLSAFWIDDTISLKWIYQKMFVIFGGVIIPIALFPEKIQVIASLLPFASTYYNPMAVIVNFSFPLFFKTLLLQIFWLILILFFAQLIFKKGIKNVSIQGA